MAKITRAFQKIFADGITATGNIAEFGSLAEGSPQYSKDPVQIQSRAAWLSGWAAATIGNQSPAFQDFNGYQYLISRQIAYLLQAGIAEWDTTTVYYIGSFCQVAGVVYKSKIDNNQGNAVGENASWGVWISAAGLSGSYADLTNKPTDLISRAWVNFDGSLTSPSIRASKNVSSVTKLGTGNFRVDFTAPMATTSYAPFGNAISASSGGDSVINFQTLATGSVSFWVKDPTNNTLINSSGVFINVMSL